MSSNLHNISYSWWVAVFFLIAPDSVIYFLFCICHYLLHYFIPFTLLLRISSFLARKILTNKKEGLLDIRTPFSRCRNTEDVVGPA